MTATSISVHEENSTVKNQDQRHQRRQLIAASF